MSRTDRWIIVGGGASGLAAAFFLKQLGIDSEIVERESALGGRMGTVRLGDRSLDCGGKNIGRRYKLFREFAGSLGTHPFEYFGLNSSQVVNGQVRTFEARSRWRSLLDVTRGISARDIVRFGHLLWCVKSDEATGYLGSKLSRRLGSRYDDRPASHYFSPEFCRRILRPMSVRMNGAEPDEVYLGNLCSNARMILDTYEQFQHGLGPLLGEVLSQYVVRLNTSVEGLLVNRGRVTGVRVKSTDGKTTDVHGAGVILATPAPTSAALTEAALPGLSQQLRSVSYYPVTLVIAEYDRPIFSPTVRAFVFDGDEAVSNAGAYGINDLHLVRYTFSGRTARKYMGASMDEDELLSIGEKALGRYVPCESGWRRRVAVRRFSPGLCAYAPHHGQLLERLQRELKTVTGLYVTGDFVQGASIEACFRSASACVRQLADEVKRSVPEHATRLELQAQRHG